MFVQHHKQKEQQSLALILVLGFLLRLLLSTATEGYPYDISCFFAWGNRMVELGAGAFYAEDYFCDYPPAYLYVLGMVSRVMRLFDINYLEKAASALLVFVPALADVGLGLSVYHIARKSGNSSLALRLAAFVAFCPLFWYDTAVWKQIDSVPALLLLGCFYLLSQAKYLPAAALYGLALAVKPQALILGPVLALCFLLPVLFAKDIKSFWRAILEGAGGILAAIVPLYLCALPFFGFGNTVSGLYQTYLTTSSSYPYASVNAFNFIAACGGNWVLHAELFAIDLFGRSFLLFFSWATFGKLAIIASSVFVVCLALRAQRNHRFSPMLLAGVYMVAVFTFGHSMHERYLLLGVALLLGAVAQCGNRALLSIAGGLSLTSLFNMAVVYTVVDTDDNFLTSATSTLTMRIVGLLETILCIWLLYEAWQICSGAVRASFGASPVRQAPLRKGKQTRTQKEAAKKIAAQSVMQPAQAEEGASVQPSKAAIMAYHPAPQPGWTRKEKSFVVVLTLAVAVLSFAYLGDVTAPQNAHDTTTQTAYELVIPQGDADTMWVYTGVVQSGAVLNLSDQDGMSLMTVDLPIGGLFQWETYSIPACDGYLITVSGGEIIEIGFKDIDGNLLALSGMDETGTATALTSAMFDEQSLIPDVISQLNSFYFDEIYHARTAYESINGLDIYEISHPPMGKNFIALGIVLFGMTGFGWRCVGVLFGVLMVPVIYWLTRRLTRSPLAAGLVALLLSFDFMRYTQSRIATIDTISAFFILLAAACMVWYCQSVLEKGVRASIVPMALSGIAFGFGAASKWTGLYGGVALAILYFGVLCLRGYQQKNRITFYKECKAAIAGGVLFFVLIPLAIYLASYLPYYLADPNFGLAEWWQNQEYMYWYHSSLDATHSFSSSWYSWVFDLRPVWYYMGSDLPAGTYASIAGFYNPVLCWVGLVAWLRLVVRALQGKGSAVGNALIILLLSQFLPWLLVTRCTFLYHYYPSFLFTVIAIGLWFEELRVANKVRAYRLAGALLAVVAIFFVWFYPVLSGLPIGATWAQSLKIFASYGFYIL